jgi:hypothetical protein
MTIQEFTYQGKSLTFEEGFRFPPRNVEELLKKLKKWLVTPAARPNRLIDSTDKLPSKWRKYWYSDIGAQLYFALNFNLIQNDELKRKISFMREKWASQEFGSQKLVKQENINEADDLLVEIIMNFMQTHPVLAKKVFGYAFRSKLKKMNPALFNKVFGTSLK